AAGLRGDEAAQAIQLYMVYAPEPPFDSGTPESAPADIVERTRRSLAALTAQREATARRVAARLGISPPPVVAASGLRRSPRGGRQTIGSGVRSRFNSPAPPIWEERAFLVP